MHEVKNYIGGGFHDAASGEKIKVFNPATNEQLGSAPKSGKEEVDQAVKAAEEAFPKWEAIPADQRADYLRIMADLIFKDLGRLAKLESDDTGKPVWLSESVDIPRGARNLKFFASAAEQFSSESHQTDKEALNYTLRNPVGIAGCISPWNLPLYLFTWKIAPALAAGNCVIAKPSELTPMTAFELAKIADQAGLPKGVLNILHGLGNEAGQAIVEHPSITAISFTGGTETGKSIARTAGPMFKKLSLELGGKNPTIIFDDCDKEEAIKTSIRAAFANQGEICLCGSRILVHENIYDQVKLGFINAINQWVTGDPLDRNVKSGAMISRDHMEKVQSYLSLAKEEGGEILAGGETIQPEGRCAKGNFMRPAVIEGLPQECRTNREEIFGPVATLIPFKDEKEAIEKANDTNYGLSASVWTNDLGKAQRVTQQLESGIIWVNCWLLRDLRTPFGGMKQSGVGREGGEEAMRFFTEPKNVCIKW